MSSFDELHRTSYKWLISDFETSTNQILKSKKFTMSTNPKVEWGLVMKTVEKNHCHYCQSRVDMSSISLHLENYVTNENSVILIVHFSILNNSNEKVFSRQFNINGKSIVCGKTYGFEHFIFKNQLEELLVNNELEICCVIKESSEAKLENVLSPKPFINNQTFSDGVIIVGKEKMYCHKVILSSKNPVFKNMFLSNMKEFNSNEVKVQNVELEVFNELLRFMYTEKVEKLDELGLEIFEAVHIYQIDDLSLICEHTLKTKLSIENCINVLKMAENYDSKYLNDYTIPYVVKNLKTVKTSPDFKDLVKTYPISPFELLLEIAFSNSK